MPSRYVQKLSIVEILAWSTRAICFIRWLLPGSSSSRLRKASAILDFISSAAALVKVTTTMESISIGAVSSITRSIILLTRTAVLPEPAAALTSILQSLASIASSCSLVHAIVLFLPSKCFPYIFLIKLLYCPVSAVKSAY